MSKYIRTKYGIHIKNIFGKETDEKEWESLGYKVINQSDTIEELCDEFVITKNNEGIEFWKDFDALKQCSAHFVQNDFDDIYGAIWTKWGLRYVAKINNKEDLELI